MGRVRKIVLWSALILLGIFLSLCAFIIWFFSIVEFATDPVSRFIVNNSAYTFREIPEDIVPLGISRENFLKYKGVKKYKPIEDHNTIDGREGFHRILRNRMGRCDMDLRIYAIFNDYSELTSLNGFTPTYMCTIEP